MSRCFPFPPPGYEKTPARPDAQLASNLQQQLDKDKHKEKKHKKDKDRKEGKEKKDKDKHKDKHKDKKDRKEKHKDKKKEKAKDKSRESVEGVERHDEVLHDQKVGESSRKSEEFKDIKSKENFVRKIPDEKGASQPIENFVVSNDRSRGGFSAAPAIEKDRSGVNKMSNHSSHTSRKNEGLGQQNININQQKNGTATAALRRSENLTTSAQQRTASGFTPVPTTEERVRVGRPPSNTEATPRKEGIGQRISNISILVQKRNDTTNREIAKKEVGTTSPLLPNHVNTMPKGNGKVGRPMENTAASMHRFDSPTTSSAAAGMERGMPRSSVPSPSITIRRPNGMVRAPENLSVSTNKPDVGNLPPANWKEKEQGGRLLQANISTDQKLVTSKPLSLDKGADGRTERMEKVKDGAPKKEDKKSDRHEKKKRKEKDKHKEKKREKEAKKEKSEQNHKEHDHLRENNINYQIDTHHLKPSVPPLAPGAPLAPSAVGKSVVADEKKRKSHETNGYLQNVNDMRPTKLPRPALPSNRVENGTASPVAAPLSSVKPEAINNEKADKLHKKEEKLNGNQQAQQSSVDPVAAAYENGKPSRKSPHPDCKYLSQIYSIPEAPQMMEWPEHEGGEWLFDQGSTQSRKINSEPEADGVPKVWAQALKIDPGDVIALPYVIPY